MRRFSSTYSKDYIPPEREGKLPACHCCRISTPIFSPGTSRRSSCASTASRVQAIQQINFQAACHLCNMKELCMEKSSTKKPPDDPCCVLRKIRESHMRSQDPNRFQPRACHCRPKLCTICNPTRCHCCRVRFDEPQIEQVKRHHNVCGSLRNYSRLRFDTRFSNDRNS